MEAKIRKQIEKKLASPRKALQASLIEADLRECKLTNLTDIMLPFDELTGVFGAHPELSEFGKALEFCNDLLGQIATEHISHYTGLSYVFTVYELMSDQLDLFLKGDTNLDRFHLFLEKVSQAFLGVENVKVVLASSSQEVIQDMPPQDLIDDGTFSDFINEVTDGLETVEENILEMEQDPSQLSLIDLLFRVMHTIKGTAGFMGMPTISKVAHKTEDVLGEIRDGKRGLVPNVFDLMFKSVDTLKNLIIQLTSLVQGTEVKPVNIGNFFRALDVVYGLAEPDPNIEQPKAQSPLSKEEETNAAAMLAAMEEAGEQPGPGATKDEPTLSDVAKKGDSGKGPTKIQDMLKVPAERLDELSNLVGEMVVALSLLTQNPIMAELTDRNVNSQLDHLDKITESLRDKVLGIRMFPIGTVFSKLSRQVRDLSQKSGKKIDLQLKGVDTLVDKSIIDNIYAPLMHLVRNSIDHGIEPPGERGDKNEVGEVEIKAQHLGDAIEIAISDDGKGLDKERILEKAIERGLVKNKESLTEKEIFGFIFMPGFSTAKQVTDISGRGVGMDVVRKTIESLRGKIETESTPGKGTKFILKMPLTTSIIEGLVGAVGGNRFIMPILDVLQTITPEREDLKGIQGRENEFFLLAGEMIPIVRLYEVYQLEPDVTDPGQAVLVVVNSAGKKYGIMVDELLHRQQIVIQPLGERFKRLKGVSGGTILGDGRVGLILDPVSLVQKQPIQEEV